jgi:hypothetical protein
MAINPRDQFEFCSHTYNRGRPYPTNVEKAVGNILFRGITHDELYAHCEDWRNAPEHVEFFLELLEEARVKSLEKIRDAAQEAGPQSTDLEIESVRKFVYSILQVMCELRELILKGQPDDFSNDDLGIPSDLRERARDLLTYYQVLKLTLWYTDTSAWNELTTSEMNSLIASQQPVTIPWHRTANPMLIRIIICIDGKCCSLLGKIVMHDDKPELIVQTVEDMTLLYLACGLHPTLHYSVGSEDGLSASIRVVSHRFCPELEYASKRDVIARLSNLEHHEAVLMRDEFAIHSLCPYSVFCMCAFYNAYHEYKPDDSLTIQLN